MQHHNDGDVAQVPQQRQQVQHRHCYERAQSDAELRKRRVEQTAVHTGRGWSCLSLQRRERKEQRWKLSVAHKMGVGFTLKKSFWEHTMVPDWTIGAIPSVSLSDDR